MSENFKSILFLVSEIANKLHTYQSVNQSVNQYAIKYLNLQLSDVQLT